MPSSPLKPRNWIDSSQGARARGSLWRRRGFHLVGENRLRTRRLLRGRECEPSVPENLRLKACAAVRNRARLRCFAYSLVAPYICRGRSARALKRVPHERLLITRK